VETLLGALLEGLPEAVAEVTEPLGDAGDHLAELANDAHGVFGLQRLLEVASGL
jgi:hypothetical protein